MSLLAVLKLPPKPAASGSAPQQTTNAATSTAPQDAVLVDLRGDLDVKLAGAGRTVDGLGDSERKRTLQDALAVAVGQRQAAEKMTDPAGRLAALKQAQSRVDAVVAQARVAASGDARQAGAAPSGTSGGAKPASSDPESDVLREAYAARLKTAVKVAAQLDANGKRTLAEALAAADVERQAAERMTDPKNRQQALRASHDRIDAALATADPGGAKSVRIDAAALLPKLQSELRAAEAAARAAQADADKAGVDASTAKSLKLSDKAEVDQRKVEIDKRLAIAQKRLKQLDGDVAAITSSSTGDDVLHAILARQGQGDVGAKGEYVRAPASGLQRGSDATTVSTVVGGKAVTTTTAGSRSIGKDGVTDTRSTDTTTVQGDRTTTSSDKRTSTIGLAGASRERVQKVEHEESFEKSSTETKTATTASLATGTATHGSTTTTTRTDGSSTASSGTVGLERADGKLAATGTASRTDTDAKGNETKTTASGKQGLIAGKDGIGGFGSRELSRETKSPGGLKTGKVLGLNQSIVCNIVKDEKSGMYDLTTTIDLGVNVGGSRAYDKEPEKGKPDEDARVTAKLSASISGKVTMTRTHRLDEQQAQAYTEALKTGNGTDAEFAIIRIGLSGNWQKARETYLALSGHTASKETEDGLEKGGSLKTAKERKTGVTGELGVKGGGIGGGVSAGYEHTADGSLTLSKDKDGKVAYDAKQGDAEKQSRGVKVNVGAVEGGFSVGSTLKTSTGYKIAIPTDAAPAEADAMRKALNACNSQADLDAFAKSYPKAIQETTRGSGHEDTTEVTAGLAGGAVKAGLKFGKGVAKERTTDKDGKTIGDKTTGTNEGGMDVTVLGRKVTSSSKQEAVSTTDAQGKSHTDVTQTDTSTDMAKLLGSLPGSGEGGALAKATGGTDTEKKTMQGLGLDESALDRLGDMARNNWNGWMNAAVNAEDRQHWATAGRRIQNADDKTRRSVVAAQLAEFVGRSSSGNPRQVIHDAVRGKKGVGGGDGWEFTGALASMKPEYDETVVAESEKTISALVSDPAQAKAQGDKLLASLAKLQAAVDREPNFASPSLRGEMLAAIGARGVKVRKALLDSQTSGPLAPGDSAAAVLVEKKTRYNQLLRNCLNYQEDEKKLFEQVQANLESVFGASSSAAENVKPLAELGALYEVWDKEYEELATLVQVDGIGNKDSYFTYRPDRKRFKLAHDNKKPYGERKKNESKGDEAKRYDRLEGRDEKDRLAASQERPIEEVRAERQKADEERVKNGTRIQNELPGARKRADARGFMLYGFISAGDKPLAAKAYDDGKKLFDEGEALQAKVHRDHMPELVDFGAKALAKYRAALALFDKGVAQFPKDWSK